MNSRTTSTNSSIEGWSIISKLSTDDEVHKIDFGFRRAPPDGRAFDGAVHAEALIHAHAHHAPFERTEHDPGLHVVDTQLAAACGLIASQQIIQFAEAADGF